MLLLIPFINAVRTKHVVAPQVPYSLCWIDRFQTYHTGLGVLVAYASHRRELETEERAEREKNADQITCASRSPPRSVGLG
jgi:hypothetical protein